MHPSAALPPAALVHNRTGSHGACKYAGPGRRVKAGRRCRAQLALDVRALHQSKPEPWRCTSPSLGAGAAAQLHTVDTTAAVVLPPGLSVRILIRNQTIN